MMARMGGRGVVRMGLLGRSGAGSCPNLLQRPSAARSAASRSAEYQRFSSGVSARSGPLQQIWTNGAVAGPCADGGPGDRPGARSGPPRPERSTLPVGLSTVKNAYGTIYAQTMASAMIAALPLTILFMLFQRQIIKAVATTGLGGQ